MRTLAFLLLILPVLTLFPATEPAVAQELLLRDELPNGDFKWCAPHAGYMYVAAGPVIEIWDLTDPANLAQVGKTPVFAGVAGPPAFAGSLAYMPFGGVVELFDAGDPADPVDLGPVPVPYGGRDHDLLRGHKALNYDASTQRLYYLGWKGFPDKWGIRIYDATQPDAPTLLVEEHDLFFPFFGDETGEIVNSFVLGSRIYYQYNFDFGLGWRSTVAVIDASNPVPGGLYYSGSASLGSFRSNHGMVTNGNELFVLAGSELHAYTMEMDGSLSLAGTLALTDPGEPVLHDPTTLLVVGSSSTATIDVSDPTAMTVASTVGYGMATSYRARALGTTLVVPQRSRLDVATVAPLQGTLEASIRGLYRPNEIAAYGNHLFVAAGGVWAVEVDDGTFGARFPINALSTRFLDVGTGPVLVHELLGDLRFYDVSDVTNPQLLAEEINPGLIVRGISTQGEYTGLIGSDSDGEMVEIWDHGNPAHPGRRGRVVVPSWNDVDLDDVILNFPAIYVAHGDDLWVFDFSNVNNPSSTTTLDLVAGPLTLAQTGSHLFVSSGGVVFVYDVSVPLAPVLVNDLPLGGGSLYGVDQMGPYHAVSHGSRVWLFDLSDITSESLVDVATRPNSRGEFVVTNEVGYDLTWWHSLQSYRAETSTGVGPGRTRSGSLLMGSAPNPGPGRTTIRWSPALQGPVELTIYDVAGRLVRRWNSSTALPHSYQWNGRDEAGQRVASGVYYYQLRTREGTEQRRLVLVR